MKQEFPIHSVVMFREVPLSSPTTLLGDIHIPMVHLGEIIDLDIKIMMSL